MTDSIGDMEPCGDIIYSKILVLLSVRRAPEEQNSKSSKSINKVKAYNEFSL